jgi:porphobilinogen synthase
VRETRLSVDQLVYPLFIVPGSGVREEIRSLPDVFHLSVDQAEEEARLLADLGIPAVLLFGLPPSKDEEGSGAWAAEGEVQRATRAIKNAVPDMVVIADTCLCEYTSHGHCGVLDRGGPGREPTIVNDASLLAIARTAVSQAEAGADVVAPSDMLDGRVAAIRAALDERGFVDTAILSYAAKYASAFYGPFREAADSAPQLGDRRGYQMDPANAREALREVRLDLDEGADAVMVKPAGPYLDIIRSVSDEFPEVPLAAYQVSGEYAMLKAAAANGWLDGQRAAEEAALGIVRAGADILITYFAKDLARCLR